MKKAGRSRHASPLKFLSVCQGCGLYTVVNPASLRWENTPFGLVCSECFGKLLAALDGKNDGFIRHLNQHDFRNVNPGFNWVDL